MKDPDNPEEEDEDADHTKNEGRGLALLTPSVWSSSLSTLSSERWQVAVVTHGELVAVVWGVIVVVDVVVGPNVELAVCNGNRQIW